uniref:Uncharacterized protein OJ1111_A10.11 n=1 Tax=Oryza sativa subsp. japonica TaxID=39947 RepID=Q60F02_ORYSJ|nr:hypothetical protein [Oryza sativa Japonica Group]
MEITPEIENLPPAGPIEPWCIATRESFHQTFRHTNTEMFNTYYMLTYFRNYWVVTDIKKVGRDDWMRVVIGGEEKIGEEIASFWNKLLC